MPNLGVHHSFAMLLPTMLHSKDDMTLGMGNGGVSSVDSSKKTGRGFKLWFHDRAHT